MARNSIRVLYYNWAPLSSMTGGGVGVYVRNLLFNIITLPKNNSAEDTHIKIIPVLLSSGYLYDYTHKPYLKKIENDIAIEEYHIVNSPITAPLETMATEMERIIDDSTITKLFEKFVGEHGPFDVIHFMSFEGISPNVLRLHEKMNGTKFVHTIHDYGFTCPNVKLWTGDEKNCYHDSGNCEWCMKTQLMYTRDFHVNMRLAATADERDSIYRIYSKRRKQLMAVTKFLNRIGLLGSAEHRFGDYRSHTLQLINEYSDAEICVSCKVAEIARHQGINAEKIVVDYIGTKVAENSLGCNLNNPFSKTFTLLYMGYMTKAKGAYMFLNCMEHLCESSVAAGMVIKLASKVTDGATLRLIDILRQYFKDVEVFDGYSHNDFPEIMRDVNLGIVPPLWEDNLPQVAIEMIANGIPVLCSCNGGAHELNSHPSFCFSNAHELEEKLVAIVDDRQQLVDYWKYASPLTTMRQHIESLMKIYQSA